MKIAEVNTESAIAWKNRLFYFEDAKYDEIMREIERWYDVDVIYKGKIPDERFQGAIQKDLKLNQVLKMLESNDVHFKVSGKEVIVTQ
jgi:ferric-dicitrate binding protein FerR (iron transport regulator)